MTGQEFFESNIENSYVLIAAAQLFFQELGTMNAQISVDPTLKFNLDLATFIKLETAVTFYRNSNPALRDPDLDQLSTMLKTTLAKIREYDNALRGLTVSTSTSEIVGEAAEERATPPVGQIGRAHV